MFVKYYGGVLTTIRRTKYNQFQNECASWTKYMTSVQPSRLITWKRKRQHWSKDKFGNIWNPGSILQTLIFVISMGKLWIWFPIHPRLLVWSRFEPFLWVWLLPVAVIRIHVGDLHAVDWGEGPWALVTPVKAIWVGVGIMKKSFESEHFTFARI